jgi:quercetin dioxygenase-like cupin family protein
MEGSKSSLFELSELVSYQADSVVSRIVLKTKTGSVTAFAFDAGQELSEHSVPHDALIQVLEGKVDVRIDGELSRLSSGEAIVLPGGIPHAIAAPARFKMLLTMLRNEPMS